MSICKVRNVRIRTKPEPAAPTLPLRHGLSHAGDGYDPVPLAGTGHKAGLMSDDQAHKLAGLSSSSTAITQIFQSSGPAKPNHPDDDEFEDGVDGFLARWQPVLWTPSADAAERGAAFVTPTAQWRLEGSKRPSWIQIQPPADMSSGFFTKPLSETNPLKKFLLLSLSLDHNQDPFGADFLAFGWSQSLGVGPIAPIDGDNIVFVQVVRTGIDQRTAFLGVNEGGGSTLSPGLVTNEPIRFLGLLKDETTYRFYLSPDGVTWRYGDSLMSSIAPDRVAVGLINTTVDNDLFGFDFFRVYPDATV